MNESNPDKNHPIIDASSSHFHKSPKALHFGAGNIGRGFIGLILTRSGYDVCFVTLNKKKISQLKRRNEYPVILANQKKDKILVQNVTAISSNNQSAITHHIIEANLITTAVGVSNLPNIADKIALGIVERIKSHNLSSLHIMACENAIHASSKLKKLVFQYIPKEYEKIINRFVSFPNTVVDQIVPAQHHKDPLAVLIEPYFEWIIDQSEMLEGLPKIKNTKLVDSLDAFIERKLFTVNTGHCTAAYYGYLEGYTTIQETMTDSKLSNEVNSVLQETGHMLIEKHNLDEREHQKYIHKILNRFANPYLTDKVTRVGRSPIRKLSINDRLVRPVLLSYDLGLDVSHLAKAIAAALLFDYEHDSEAIKLQNYLKKSDIHQVIIKYMGMPISHPIHQKIVQQYRLLEEKYKTLK